MNLCNARDPGGPMRCDLPFNHEGEHSAALRNGVHTWPNRLDKPTRALGGRTTSNRKSSLRKQSPKAKGNQGLWKVIKRAMVLAQIRTNGYTSCMECGTQNPHPLDLDHIDGRDWTPENAQLLCRSCHTRKHGDVQFSRSNV